MATEYTNMKQVLQQGGELMADAIRDEAISKGLFKTGTLARSYQSQPVQDATNGKFTISIVGIDYGDYQDKGVKGLRAGQSLAGYQFKSQAIGGDLPFPVRVYIAQNGLKPKNFIQPAVDKVINNFLAPKLEEAGVKDIENIVTTFAHGNKIEIK
jgi:hypothetical protein